jgi:hypothetical protein
LPSRGIKGGFAGDVRTCSIERLPHPKAGLFSATNLCQVVAECSTTNPKPVVEVLPEGKGKGVDGFVRSLKEELCQSELFLHQACRVKESADPRSRNRMAGQDLVCEPRLPDETSQEVGKIAISIILSPVFEIVDEDKGDVMLIEGSRQAREILRSVRMKDEGHGEGPQDRRFPPCKRTEPCHRKSA